MTDYLMQRNGVYYYRRRVPEYVAHYDPRKFVRSSLQTRDRREAMRKSMIHNDFIEEYWRSLVLAYFGESDRSFRFYPIAFSSSFSSLPVLP